MLAASVAIEPNSALCRDRTFLSEDICVLDGEHFFVRCVLEIPVHGLVDKFGLGCWGSLSRENFDTFVSGFDECAVPGDAPWWSWLCNALDPFTDGEPVGCEMFLQPDRQRPVLKVKQEDHPLFAAQQNGISPEQLLAIYEHYGHRVEG